MPRHLAGETAIDGPHESLRLSRACWQDKHHDKRRQPVRGTTFLKWTGFFAGCVIALEAMISMAMLGMGEVSRGASFMLAGSITAMISATPLLALPFSMRLARLAFVALLFLFAAGILWLVFTSTRAQWTHQLAAIAFAVLLIIRVGLKMRPSPHMSR